PAGLLLVDKPEKLTSHDVVDEARRLLDLRRIGHTGTLDPAATGLLVLCVGRAVRLQSFLTGFDKSYEGEMLFGVETDTYDRDGTPVGPPHPEPNPDPARLREEAARFTGELLQAPPPFSAKKVAGRKFYDLARRGEAVPHAPKSVKVSALDILDVRGDRAAFRVSCSSGTYVRSLVHDIGKGLGPGAHLVALRRTAVGPFRLEDAVTLPGLEAIPAGGRLVRPHWIPLAEIPLPYPTVPLAAAEASRVRHGNAVPVRLPAGAAGAEWVRLEAAGALIALAQLEPLGRGAVALARPKIVLSE
ncbi:MAG TPA: tRNA pseudouridine(55) synthase TruB, partial [Thermoanaerobaculia bacterium]|nr:tRNA pseudouridine(55) synthase TruB [Thermoanaerobaculia bacterium]